MLQTLVMTGVDQKHQQARKLMKKAREALKTGDKLPCVNFLTEGEKVIKELKQVAGKKEPSFVANLVHSFINKVQSERRLNLLKGEMAQLEEFVAKLA